MSSQYVLSLIEATNTSSAPPAEIQLDNIKKYIIGRGSVSDITFTSFQISRKHATLEFKEDKWLLTDFSTNGITLNTSQCRLVKAKPTELKSNDIIHFVPSISYCFKAKLEPKTVTITSEESEEEQDDDSDSLLSLPASHSLLDSQQSSREGTPEPVIEDEPIVDCSPPSKKRKINVETENADLTKKIFQLEANLKAKELQHIIEREEWNQGLQRNVHKKSELAVKGFKEKLMEIMESEYNCSICNEVFIHPCTTECGHTFCNNCISEWLKKKPECPICRHPSRHQIVRHVEMHNYINKVYDLVGGDVQLKREMQMKERQSEEIRTVPILPKKGPGRRRRGNNNANQNLVVGGPLNNQMNFVVLE